MSEALWRVECGDAFELLPGLAEASIDACVTDPPYGLEFMGKDWDRLGDGFRRAENPADVGRDDPFGRASRTSPEYRAGRRAQEWHEAWAREVLRVLKPGAHLLAFGGTRTYHRLACALEDAGFEVRDCLAWLYGSGFPKSKNAGDGWGTGLKPAFEPILLARKPLSEKNVIANVQRWGTGALNIDGCRIEGEKAGGSGSPPLRFGGQNHRPFHDEYDRSRAGEPSAQRRYPEEGGTDFALRPGPRGGDELGRWPANVLLDAEAGELLDAQAGERPAGGHPNQRGADGERSAYGSFAGGENEAIGVQNTTGGASRFFYCAKPDREERNRGLSGPEKPLLWSSGEKNPGSFQSAGTHKAARNYHPTVKPVELMQWLCRLVTPAGGLVLDPFAGSGTTGMAALREGFAFLGFERDRDYCDIAATRIVGDAPLFNTPADSSARLSDQQLLRAAATGKIETVHVQEELL